MTFSGRPASPSRPLPARLSFLPPPTSLSHAGVQSAAARGEGARAGRGAVTCARTCWGARCAAREKGRGRGGAARRRGGSGSRSNARARWPPRLPPWGRGRGGAGGLRGVTGSGVAGLRAGRGPEGDAPSDSCATPCPAAPQRAGPG